jgi:UDP-N-acetylmuramate-alanine ligase
MLVGWTPSVEEGVRFLMDHLEPGDRVVTIGAGDVDRAAEALLETLG